MNISLFNKKYWLRHFGKQRVVKGYLTSGKEDRIVSLNVHPLGTDKQQALPEGEREIKRLEAHGTDELVVADKDTNRKGDLLYYHGEWYECVNAQLWDHTVLAHMNYQFVIVPKSGAKSIDTDNPPEADPNGEKSGYAVYELKMPVASDTVLGGVIIKPGSGLCIDSDGYLSITGASKEEAASLYEGALGI